MKANDATQRVSTEDPGGGLRTVVLRALAGERGHPTEKVTLEAAQLLPWRLASARLPVPRGVAQSGRAHGSGP